MTYENKNKNVRLLKNFLLIYLAISISILLAYSLYKLNTNGLMEMSICFKEKCFSTFFQSLQGLIGIFDFLLSTIVAIVTVFGVYFALITYINSIKTSRTNIHLIHLTTFKEYILSELEGNNQLSTKSFDIFKWYNLIFPYSRDGSIDVGKSYLEIIDNFNRNIRLSNDTYSSADFPYIKHQKRMISQFRTLGITINLMPRNDFYEIEKQLFKLIEKTNEEYCFMNGKGKLIKRTYR